MAASNFRLNRLRTIQELKRSGLSSSQIGKQVGLAPSTVRDYLNDPNRTKAVLRQRRKLAVLGGPTLGGTEVVEVKRNWRRGAPAKGNTIEAAERRGRQLRAIVGFYR